MPPNWLRKRSRAKQHNLALRLPTNQILNHLKQACDLGCSKKAAKSGGPGALERYQATRENLARSRRVHSTRDGSPNRVQLTAGKTTRYQRQPGRACICLLEKKTISPPAVLSLTPLRSYPTPDRDAPQESVEETGFTESTTIPTALT